MQPETEDFLSAQGTDPATTTLLAARHVDDGNSPEKRACLKGCESGPRHSG